jgi:hypothetical protein
VERLVAEYEASGLGRQAFCEKHGLSLSTLNRHRKRQQSGNRSGCDDRLVSVELRPAPRLPKMGLYNELVVVLSSGRRIEVRGAFDAKVLRQLVRVLEQV